MGLSGFPHSEKSEQPATAARSRIEAQAKTALEAARAMVSSLISGVADSAQFIARRT
jgi:hypothetical protein